MLTKFILYILLSSALYANNALENTYFVDSNNIYISTIIEDAPKKLIYTIPTHDYTKKIKSKDLILTLKKHGYKGITSKSRYIKFIIKSPIDTTKISDYVREYYLRKYEKIDIKEVRVEPRGHMTSMPKKYSISIKSKNYLSRNGIVSITTSENKKLFFNYDIVANVWIYLSRKQINKETELSAINTVKKSIILENFMAKPIQNIDTNALQGKYRIKKDEIITTRYVEPLNLVKRNSFIDVTLDSKNMSISFSAQALGDGRLGDIIMVETTDGKKLKVKITGKNKAEVR
ncbi:MAG: flagella basal body P-ring formation protein FlgA [Sulfurimonas sp.]|jgi:flagella basal body P-ring formation protein FlgA